MHLRLSLFTFVLSVAGLQASASDDLYRITNGTSDSHVEYHRMDLAPGQEITLADLSGPGKVTYFYWTDDSHLHPAEGSGAMYEGLVLRIFWDDAPAPSVQVPLWGLLRPVWKTSRRFRIRPHSGKSPLLHELSAHAVLQAGGFRTPERRR